jgi:hypothetical protein
MQHTKNNDKYGKYNNYYKYVAELDTNLLFYKNYDKFKEVYEKSLTKNEEKNKENAAYAVELFDFAYDDILPSDKPLLIKAILELVDLKDELDINNYVVTGEGAPLYRQLFNKPFI